MWKQPHLRCTIFVENTRVVVTWFVIVRIIIVNRSVKHITDNFCWKRLLISFIVLMKIISWEYMRKETIHRQISVEGHLPVTVSLSLELGFWRKLSWDWQLRLFSDGGHPLMEVFFWRRMSSAGSHLLIEVVFQWRLSSYGKSAFTDGGHPCTDSPGQ